LIVQSWLLKLRSQGKAVVIVHHAGKGGDQRGTSAREDVLDTVVKLSRPTDCQGDEGLRAEWVFAKHRGFYGADAMSLEVSLTVNQGELTWTWQPLETSLVLQVAEHLNETECSLSDIARDMNLPKTTVWRLKKRAEAMGLLKSKPGGQKRND
jgi:putative DNA primase/helicase